MRYFGTDGIRGKVFQEIDQNIAFDCGNALCKLTKNPKIVLGKDSRISGDFLTLAFSLGVISGGGIVEDVGICPTAGIAYLTKTLGYDYGVVISASHNPPDNNGIKIFNSKGQKLGDDVELELEKYFGEHIVVDAMHLGKFTSKPKLIKKYIQFLYNSVKKPLKNLKIVLDCCFGASTVVAPYVFKSLGADVFVINKKPDGEKINIKCGATDTTMLKRVVKEKKADLGLAFDGDSDRIIAVDELGTEVDGDKIIYLFALDKQKQGKLSKNVVVATKLTNLGVQNELESYGIKTILADIGDKYVIEEMLKNGAVIGGEKSGHIILLDYLPTGDGILCGLKLAEILKTESKKLSQLADVKLFPQYSIDCIVKDKNVVINNEKLKKQVEEIEKTAQGKSRVLVRKSGTEPKIRIMAESENEEFAKKCVNILENLVKDINNSL